MQCHNQSLPVVTPTPSHTCLDELLPCGLFTALADHVVPDLFHECCLLMLPCVEYSHDSNGVILLSCAHHSTHTALCRANMWQGRGRDRAGTRHGQGTVRQWVGDVVREMQRASGSEEHPSWQGVTAPHMVCKGLTPHTHMQNRDTSVRCGCKIKQQQLQVAAWD